MQTNNIDAPSKTCTKCGELKSLDLFAKRKTRKDGRCSHCLECNRKKTAEWVKENKDKHLSACSAWHRANREKANEERMKRYFEAMKDPEKRKKHKDTGAEWQKRNPCLVKKSNRNWTVNNPDKNSARVARRRASLLLATPAWASKEEIDSIYSISKFETERTGVQHHVDHIVPLKGKTVCGLHVACNLRVITATENARKSAKLEDIYLA